MEVIIKTILKIIIKIIIMLMIISRHRKKIVVINYNDDDHYKK